MNDSSSSDSELDGDDARPSIIDLTSTDLARSSDVHFPLIHTLSANESVLAVEVDDDNLYAGLNTGEINVWTLSTARLTHSLQGHEEAVLALHLSEKRSRLFSAGSDSTLNIWSTDGALELLYTIKSDPGVGDIFAIAWSEARKTVYCGAQDHSVLWFCLGDEDDEQLKPVSPVQSRAPHKFFDSEKPLGEKVNGEMRGKPTIKRARHQRYFQTQNIKPFAHSGAIQSLLLLKEWDLLVTGGSDGYVRLWNLGKQADRNAVITCATRLPNSRRPVWCMASVGDLLYCGGGDGYVNVFNLQSKQLIFPIYVGHGDIMALQVNDGNVFCGTDTGLTRWVDPSFTNVSSWQSNDGKLLASTISRQGSRTVFMSGGNDNKIKFWDISSVCQVPRQRLTWNDEMIEQLVEFVGYKTVSSDQRFKAACNEIATSMRKCFIQHGAVETSLLAAEPGMNPIIFARFASTKASDPTPPKTLMFYGHYDVVDAKYDPAGEEGKWKTDPFEAVSMNGYLYGRGMTDNKGPVTAAMFGVFELIKANRLHCNVVFLIEGEEEAGSRGFAKTIRAHKDLIGPVDYILLANSYWLDERIPCLTYGMRGVIHSTITVQSPLPDQHSGVEGKASVHETLKDLTVLLSRLVGPSATDIRIPNFFEGVPVLTTTERKRYEAVTSALQEGHPEISDPEDYLASLIQRWSRPNLTIHSIKVPESKNAVTIPSLAEAAISIRIVPGQHADKIANALVNFLTQRFDTWSNNHLDVVIRSKADAWLGDPSNVLFQALERAITKAWSSNGRRGHGAIVATEQSKHRRNNSKSSKDDALKPLYIREGGSIPAISILEKEFKAPAAMFPCGQASDNAHLDNERMRIENLFAAKEVFASVFAEL